MTQILSRRLRSTPLTGPEMVRLITKNVVTNRSNQQTARVDIPVITTLATSVVLEDAIIVVQDTTLKR